MKKILLLLRLFFSAAALLAQQHMPLQRSMTQNEKVFTLTYENTSDSLHGFFMLTEQMTGQVKLVEARCKVPYRFSGGTLLFSGEKMLPGFKAVFVFELLQEKAVVSGHFRAENYGRPLLDLVLEPLAVEHPQVLLAGHSSPPGQTTVPEKKSLQPAETPAVDANTSDPAQANITFRVQLAASMVPMDKQKLGQLTGLGLEVQEERIDGYYKYTIGSENSLHAAQELLHRLATRHFKKPFIVAYRQNSRITVQQALAEINRHR